MTNSTTDTPSPAQGPQISKEAIEAAALALEAWDRGVPWDISTPDDIPPGYWDMWQSGARLALQAAWPHLHRHIPNTVEALEGLGAGTIIRHVEGLLWVKIADHLWAEGPQEPAVRTGTVMLSASADSSWVVIWDGGMWEGDDE